MKSKVNLKRKAQVEVEGLSSIHLQGSAITRHLKNLVSYPHHSSTRLEIHLEARANKQISNILLVLVEVT
jgi:hypothetical protein